MPERDPRYTSRIQKGGAMFNEMRQLVRLWRDVPLEVNKAALIAANPTNMPTRARAVDVLNRIFVPRFVDGPVPDGWKLVQVLENLEAPSSTVRPIYFWLTALAEPLLHDLCTEYLAACRDRGLRNVETADAAAWVAGKGQSWSETVIIKVTRAMLAALRDFGILEGRVRKQIATPSLNPAAFAFIAFNLHRTGVPARNLMSHSDWKLFLIGQDYVEHLFLECHQRRLLDYQAAGSVVSLSFPSTTVEEYARVVLGR
jgi:hypothetical protein